VGIVLRHDDSLILSGENCNGIRRVVAVGRMLPTGLAEPPMPDPPRGTA
jgi:hypothetical protein